MFLSDIHNSATPQKGGAPGALSPSLCAATLQLPSECVCSFVSSSENNCFSRRAADKRGRKKKKEGYYTTLRLLDVLHYKNDFDPSIKFSLKINISMNKQRKCDLAALHMSILTRRVGEVEDAGGRLQQVRAAGRQVSGDGHDGHAVAALLGAHDAVVLRLDHAAIAAEESGDGESVQGRKYGRKMWSGGTPRLK